MFTIAFKVYSALDDHTYLDEAVLTMLFILLPALMRHIFKIFISKQTTQRLHHQLLTDTLVNKSLNCNKSVLTYVKESAQMQDLKEVMFAYFVIWRWGKGISQEELDGACEHILVSKFKVELDFEVNDALEKLRVDNLIVLRGDLYFAVPIQDAIKVLTKKLDEAIAMTFR